MAGCQADISGLKIRMKGVIQLQLIDMTSKLLQPVPDHIIRLNSVAVLFAMF
jgi:hypothetical protein